MVTKGLLRGGIPFIIMGGSALFLYFQGKYPVVENTFFVSLIIFFVSAASIIYNQDNWSLTKQSAVYFLILLITIYPIFLLSGWFTITSVFDAFKVLIIFVIFCLFFWFMIFILVEIFSW